MLHIAYTGAKLWEGPCRLHPLQAACRKLQEGADTRPVTLHKERGQQRLVLIQKAAAQGESFALYYCIDMGEISRFKKEYSKNLIFR